GKFIGYSTASNSFSGGLEITKGVHATGSITTGTDLRVNGNTNLNGIFVLGDNGDAGSIDTNDWDIDTLGAMTGISGITNDSAYTQTGTSANALTGLTSFSGGASSSTGFEITTGNLGINAGAMTNTRLEVGGTASISGTTTLAGQTYTWPSSQTTSAFLQTNGSGALLWTTTISGTFASLSQNFDPTADNIYDLGDPNYRWRTGYFGTSLGINNGGTLNTTLEVGGTASISNTLTLAGILTGSNTGSNSFAGSLDITKGLRATQADFDNILITTSGGGLTFNGGGTNIISSTGTLQVNAFTLGGNVTANSKDITGVNYFSFANASGSDRFELTGAN
ncbi:MAG: hypothetical protein AAB857_02820, partial [Patescibacteria group bacterium]